MFDLRSAGAGEAGREASAGTARCRRRGGGRGRQEPAEPSRPGPQPCPRRAGGSGADSSAGRGPGAPSCSAGLGRTAPPARCPGLSGGHTSCRGLGVQVPPPQRGWPPDPRGGHADGHKATHARAHACTHTCTRLHTPTHAGGLRQASTVPSPAVLPRAHGGRTAAHSTHRDALAQWHGARLCLQNPCTHAHACTHTHTRAHAHTPGAAPSLPQSFRPGDAVQEGNGARPSWGWEEA